ncbi:MAG: ARPP-1 family domain-containing protein [Fimbriimonas sp.]
MTTLTLSILALSTGLTAQTDTGFRPAKGYQHQNLVVFPLYDSIGNARPGDYITLDEGLKAKTVIVTEKGGTAAPLVRPRNGVPRAQRNLPSTQNAQTFGGADVNTLWLINRSGKKLMLIAGEMVVGGQQDRIIQKDGIIPPGKQAVNLDVFCVEHGRWTPKTAQFAAPAVNGSSAPGGAFRGGIADPRVRGAAQAKRDQSAVWQEVDGSLKKNRTVNDTQTYNENLSSRKVQGSVDQYVRGIERQFPLSSAVGAVVAVNGRIVWMDRFASNATFRKYWPKLIRSYALEGMGALNQPATKQAPATYADAVRYADDRTGTARFEGEEGVWKLIRTESPHDVRFELQDVTGGKASPLHVSRMRKG